jgi:hypothetical protein
MRAKLIAETSRGLPGHDIPAKSDHQSAIRHRQRVRPTFATLSGRASGGLCTQERQARGRRGPPGQQSRRAGNPRGEFAVALRASRRTSGGELGTLRA